MAAPSSSDYDSSPGPPWATITLGLVASVALICASLTELPIELTTLEAVAVVSYAWSVWLLARNNPLGWWIGLVGIGAYGVVFARAQLYAEVGIQVFYFVTSLQAIAIWLRGGRQGTERPVSHAPRRWVLVSLVLVPLAVGALTGLLIAIRGAAPFWDALTTIISITAHIYLMWRFVESWWLWIAVDVIYIPLYASRELYVTAALYAVFLVLATRGLLHFRKLVAEEKPPASQPKPGAVT